MRLLNILFTLGLITLVSADAAFAAPKKKKTAPSKAISCPNIIADRRTGTLYSAFNSKSKANPYSCFRNTADAQKDGFKSLKLSMKHNYTGWYRTDLKITKNTCDSNLTSGGPVLFFQLKENDSGVWGEFCPSLGSSYAGVQNETGLVMSGQADRNENPASSICDDGKKSVQTVVELSRVVDGSNAYNLKYKEVHSCKSAASGANTCAREFTGRAILETSNVWPVVSDDINDITGTNKTTCRAALAQSCPACHPGQDFSKITP